jgi:hypothetical protein
MALNTKYIPLKYFQDQILDKADGCPLAAGVVKFYKDQARTETKEVFKLSGTAPNYTYTSLGSTITLSSIGSFEDGSGNDITVYAYPYDSNDQLELYYATVESAGAVLQFSREGFPNISETDVDAADIDNYIPNGQFLGHSDIFDYATPDPETGKISADFSTIAEGGWYFQRSGGSTATDFVFFDRFGGYVDNPKASPRYSVRVKNTVPDLSDTSKLLQVVFKDVNKFASDTEYYTFSFAGKSESGGESNIEIVQIKNYGTGGSSLDTDVLKQITLSTSWEIYNISFIPGTNSGKTIGSNDDDTIAFAISLPTTFIFENSFTNFILTNGQRTINSFPPTPDSQFMRDMMHYMPVASYTNENLFLPMRLGLNGYEYDTTKIGKYAPTSLEYLEVGELWCDGNEYRVDSYSTDGIPYRRLYEKWSVTSQTGLSIYGAGSSEMEFFPIGAIPTASYQMRAVSAGAVTAAADGSTPTGFTFTPVQPNPYIVDIAFLAATALSGGEFWTYENTNGSDFIVWYEKDGSGTKPAGSPFKYFKVEITAADTAADVANKTARVVNGYTFKTPDWRGYFMRVADDQGMGAAGRDPDESTRGDRGDGTGGGAIGSTQSFAVEDHKHNKDDPPADGFPSTTAGSVPITGGTQSWGANTTGLVAAGYSVSTETRSVNRYAGWIVYY